MKCATARVAAVVALSAVLVSDGCSGSDRHHGSPGSNGLTGVAAPSAEQLESLLMTELDRLGKDPDKTAAAAPQGEDNRVFNLTALVIDPDGTGPGLPTAVELSWTERCIGDYNQDGLVGVSDLTPLGQRFNEQVEYYDAGQRIVDYWPVGSPLDDGGAGAGNPPADGSPADNWRLARTDGNADGLIGVSDITPIAQHWEERLSGFRVYRKRPGEADFTALPNPDDAGLGYTVPREAAFPPGSTSADPLRPVHHLFVDDQLGAAIGWYQYYVAPYDAGGDEEGLPSNQVPVDMSGGGGGSQPPQVFVAADPEYGYTPLGVTFDAAASWDPDGEVVKYEWDMDDDPSTWEYDSSPDTTMQLTYNSAGTKTQWVRVTDNDGHAAATFIKVSVGTPGGNLPPIAEVGVDTVYGDAPLEVTFDAGGSHDFDGSIQLYEWDYDGDAAVDETTSNPVVSHTYASAGEYAASVTVTDDQGATDSAGIGITASGLTGLVVDSQTQTSFGASISLAVVNGHPAVAYAYDDWGTDVEVRYIRANDPQGTSWPASFVVVHDGGLTNRVGTALDLAVVNGRPAIGYHDATVGTLLYKRASDADGSAWPGSAIVVDGGGMTFVGEYCSLAVIDGQPAMSYLDIGQSNLRYVRATDSNGVTWGSPVVVNATAGSGRYTKLLEYTTTATFPIIAHTNDSFHQAFFERADDADGTSWNPSAPLCNPGNCLDRVSMAIVDSLPAVVIYGQNNQSVVGLYYRRVTDDSTFSWGQARQLSGTGVYSGLMPCLAEVNGLPAVAYKGFGTDPLVYRRALNIDGTGWQQENELNPDLFYAPRLLEVNGAAGIACVMGSIGQTVYYWSWF